MNKKSNINTVFNAANDSVRGQELAKAFNKVQNEQPDVFGSYRLAKVGEQGYALIDFADTSVSPDKDFSFDSERPAMAWHLSFEGIKNEVIQAFLDESVLHYLLTIKKVSEKEMFELYNTAEANKTEGMGYGEKALLMLSEEEARPIIEKCKEFFDKI